MQHVKKTILSGLIGCGLVSGLVTAVVSPVWAAIEPQSQIVPPSISAPTPVTFQDQPFNSPSGTLEPLVPVQTPVSQAVNANQIPSQVTANEPVNTQSVIPQLVSTPDSQVTPDTAQESATPDVSNQIAQYHDQAVNALQTRLQPYLNNAVPAIAYQAQKANMWLLYAANEGSERSLTTARKEALQQATTIIAGLEQNQNLTTTTPILSVSKVMRRDLWANAELLKKHAGFDCANSEVAQAEVMLVWAAAEHCELGWRHSRELFASAERLINKASYEAFNCKSGVPQQLDRVTYPSMEQLNGTQSGCHGVVGQWPIINPAAPITAPVEQIVTQDAPANAVLPNTVHFALDQSSLSEPSKAVLDKVIAELTSHPDYSATLYGYTDSRGTVAYNRNLSKQRANSVEQYLNEHNIASSRIATVAAGKAKQIGDESRVVGYALSRRVELVFASSEGKEILTENQRADLQPER